VPAQSLAVEITETSTAHSEKAKATIKQLRERGFSLHIDDFGTGYSSLSYLHALAIDAIKIDKSFTQAIGTEAVTVSILPQILSMAATLKLQVIVEGVETKAQSDYFLAASQPVLAQGWYFGRPVSIEQFQSLLDEERKTLAAESDSAELSHVQVA
jgi:sensor c-di-GMP phosphodiesterase-like protein